MHKGAIEFCRASAESHSAKSLIWLKTEKLKQNHRFGYSAFARTSGDSPLRFIAGPLGVILQLRIKTINNSRIKDNNLLAKW
jgi:hypothetical protein